MSQTQLSVPPSSEFVEHRRWPPIGLVLFTLGGLLVIYYVVADIAFGVNYFYQWNPLTADIPYTLSVWAWNLAVPFAALLAGIGAAIVARISAGRLWFMIAALVVALLAPLTASFFVLWDRNWPPFVFGVGGVLIITSVLLTCWFWAQAQIRPHQTERRGADLRLIASVIFGFAAFWTCGLASSVVIYDGPLPNLAMLKVTIICIMADLVVGWGFLLAGHILASRAVGNGEAELA